MDDNIRELMLFAIKAHKHLANEFGRNDYEDSELKRVIELNGGKLRPSCEPSLYGSFELVED